MNPLCGIQTPFIYTCIYVYICVRSTVDDTCWKPLRKDNILLQSPPFHPRSFSLTLIPLSLTHTLSLSPLSLFLFLIAPLYTSKTVTIVGRNRKQHVYFTVHFQTICHMNFGVLLVS